MGRAQPSSSSRVEVRSALFDRSCCAIFVTLSRRSQPVRSRYTAGWCYPSNTQPAGANCAVRAKSALGSSSGYPSTIPDTGYEGGSGFLSGDAGKTAFADWAVVYAKYCDGGSMTGTRPDALRGLWYRGKYNLDAVLDTLVAEQGFSGYKEVILSGCSAGGMACYLHCDYVAGYFAKWGIPVKCVCDAGAFLDIDTVTGAGNVMRKRYFDMAAFMESKPGLPTRCTAAEADWRECAFSQSALKYAETPVFAINSQYNFGEWAMLASSWNDTGTAPADWQNCWPKNGGLTPQTYANCNATQKEIIAHWRTTFLQALAPATDAKSPHGAYLDSCPTHHCQTSAGWNSVLVDNTTMADSVARWYFKGSVEKHVDAPFPGNPTC